MSVKVLSHLLNAPNMGELVQVIASLLRRRGEEQPPPVQQLQKPIRIVTASVPHFEQRARAPATSRRSRTMAGSSSATISLNESSPAMPSDRLKLLRPLSASKANRSRKVSSLQSPGPANEIDPNLSLFPSLPAEANPHRNSLRSPFSRARLPSTETQMEDIEGRAPLAVPRASMLAEIASFARRCSSPSSPDDARVLLSR
jgi:hypothetical protein